MFTIVKRDDLARLRKHAEALQAEKEVWCRKAAVAEAAGASASAAADSRVAHLTGQLSAAAERGLALATDLGRAQAELDKARSELAAAGESSSRPARLPTDSLPAYVTVAVDTLTDYGRPADWDDFDRQARQ